MISLAALAAQKALWARIPDAGCKGLCQEACGPIAMTDTERGLLLDSGLRAELEPVTLDGVQVWLLLGDDRVCPLLQNGRCSAYEVRPAVCRGYGAVDDPRMLCPHGCRPEGGLMSNDEFRPLLLGRTPDVPRGT